MSDTSVNVGMIVVAVATPLLAGLLVLLAQMQVIGGVKKSRLILLVILGPGNLAVWMLFNGYLDQVGHRSVLGIGLAVLIVVISAIGGGFRRGRMLASREPEKSEEGPS